MVASALPKSFMLPPYHGNKYLNINDATKASCLLVSTPFCSTPLASCKLCAGIAQSSTLSAAVVPLGGLWDLSRPPSSTLKPD